MAKEELANLSVQELKKRQRFFTIVLGVLGGLLLVNAVLALMGGNMALVATSATLFVVGLPLMLLVKKIGEEFGRREDSTD